MFAPPEPPVSAICRRKRRIVRIKMDANEFEEPREPVKVSTTRLPSNDAPCITGYPEAPIIPLILLPVSAAVCGPGALYLLLIPGSGSYE